jgi:hypothetical protein
MEDFEFLLQFFGTEIIGVETMLYEKFISILCCFGVAPMLLVLSTKHVGLGWACNFVMRSQNTSLKYHMNNFHSMTSSWDMNYHIEVY